MLSIMEGRSGRVVDVVWKIGMEEVVRGK